MCEACGHNKPNVPATTDEERKSEQTRSGGEGRGKGLLSFLVNTNEKGLRVQGMSPILLRVWWTGVLVKRVEGSCHRNGQGLASRVPYADPSKATPNRAKGGPLTLFISSLTSRSSTYTKVSPIWTLPARSAGPPLAKHVTTAPCNPNPRTLSNPTHTRIERCWDASNRDQGQNHPAHP